MKKKKALKLKKTKISKLNKFSAIIGGSSEACAPPTSADNPDNITTPLETTGPKSWKQS